MSALVLMLLALPVTVSAALLAGCGYRYACMCADERAERERAERAFAKAVERFTDPYYRDDAICTYCGREGHRASHCPTRPERGGPRA